MNQKLPSRKEQREHLQQLRKEREAHDRARQRRRLVAAYTAAGCLGLIIGIGAVVAFTSGGDEASGEAHVSLQSGQTNGVALDERSGSEAPTVKERNLGVAARKAGCEVRAKLPIEGRKHLPEGAPTPEYKTSPPTSGNHIAPPYQQADGAYAETPGEMNVVHSLEHGRVLIQYSGELPEPDQLALRGVYDDAYSAALFFPNDEMPFDVAVASWGELLGCMTNRGAATLDAVRAFGARYQGTAPEPVEAFGPLAGPTFAERS